MVFVAVRFGRKRTMLGFFALKIVGILMALFASNYTLFAIGRFLIGGGQVGYFLPGFVLGNDSQLLHFASAIFCFIFKSFTALGKSKNNVYGRLTNFLVYSK